LKRAIITIVVLAGLVLAAYGALHVAYGAFARGVAEDAKRMEKERSQRAIIDFDTCYYSLRVPADMDHPETPPFDTTIVRLKGCTSHWLQFPAQGTGTTYRLQRDTLVREVGFYMHDEGGRDWLDISTLPSGMYHVTLLACGNGGGFTLNIE
jgi:hypothetical protein